MLGPPPAIKRLPFSLPVSCERSGRFSFIASLVRSIDLVDVCFIVIDDHLFAGVQIRAEQDDHSIRHRGRDWVLVELSDSWPIGRIPLNHHNGIVKGKYEVVDLP